MNQTKISRAPRPCSPDPTAVVLVMPGRLGRQASNDELRASAGGVFEHLARRLSQFGGEICGVILDAGILRAGLPPELSTSVCSLLSRAKSQAVVYADQIDERDRNYSALAIVWQIVSKTGLDAERDTILLTGSGWDETDQPTDLLGYAFRGMGFSVVLDPQMRLPQLPRSLSLP